MVNFNMTYEFSKNLSSLLPLVAGRGDTLLPPKIKGNKAENLQQGEEENDVSLL